MTCPHFEFILLQIGPDMPTHRDVENEAFGLADELRREERLGR